MGQVLKLERLKMRLIYSTVRIRITTEQGIFYCSVPVGIHKRGRKADFYPLREAEFIAPCDVQITRTEWETAPGYFTDITGTRDCMPWWQILPEGSSFIVTLGSPMYTISG